MSETSPFAALAVDVSAATRMPIVLPGDIDPVTDENNQEGYIEFLPWDSEPGRRLDREKQAQGLRKGFRTRSRAELLAEAENADPADEQVDRLVALVTGWHLVGADRRHIGVPFSKDNARRLFSAPETAWLRRQCFVFVSNEANFMKRSSKS